MTGGAEDSSDVPLMQTRFAQAASALLNISAVAMLQSRELLFLSSTQRLHEFTAVRVAGANPKGV